VQQRRWLHEKTRTAERAHYSLDWEHPETPVFGVEELPALHIRVVTHLLEEGEQQHHLRLPFGFYHSERPPLFDLVLFLLYPCVVERSPLRTARCEQASFPPLPHHAPRDTERCSVGDP